MKNEKQSSYNVPHCPRRQKGRQKIERENGRLDSCQRDRRVKQWARVDSSGQILWYRKLVKTRERGEKKQVYLWSPAASLGWKGTSHVSFHLALILKQRLSRLSRSCFTLHLRSSFFLEQVTACPIKKKKKKANGTMFASAVFTFDARMILVRLSHLSAPRFTAVPPANAGRDSAS